MLAKAAVQVFIHAPVPRRRKALRWLKLLGSCEKYKLKRSHEPSSNEIVPFKRDARASSDRAIGPTQRVEESTRKMMSSPGSSNRVPLKIVEPLGIEFERASSDRAIGPTRRVEKSTQGIFAEDSRRSLHQAPPIACCSRMVELSTIEFDIRRRQNGIRQDPFLVIPCHSTRGHVSLITSPARRALWTTDRSPILLSMCSLTIG